MKKALFVIIFPLFFQLNGSFIAEEKQFLSKSEFDLSLELLRLYNVQNNFNCKKILLVDRTQKEWHEAIIDTNGIIALKGDTNLYVEMELGYVKTFHDSSEIISKNINTDKNVQLISPDETRKIDSDYFEKQYPGYCAYYQISKIYHAKDGKHISFVITHICGVECGSVDFLIAKNIEGKWTLIYSENILLY